MMMPIEPGNSSHDSKESLQTLLFEMASGDQSHSNAQPAGHGFPRRRAARVVPIMKFSSPPRERHQESQLVVLCRERQWSRVVARCHSHPQEAFPQPIQPRATQRSRKRSSRTQSQERTFKKTALGLALEAGCDVCRCCTTPSHQKSTESCCWLQSATVNIIRACTAQVNCSQLFPGNTPLRDAIQFHHPPRIFGEILGYASKNALTKPDRDGQYVIDHLLQRVNSKNDSESLELLRLFLEHAVRMKIPADELSNTSNPLIRFFSMRKSMPKSGRAALAGRSLNLDRDVARSSRDILLDTTVLLLDFYPEWVLSTSHSTGCTPLHAALHHLGDQYSLIELLVNRDVDRSAMLHRNNFGDYPIHVASLHSMESTAPVFQMILSETHRKNPFWWWANEVRNGSGYTPVDLLWVRYIEDGGDNIGCFNSRYHSVRPLYNRQFQPNTSTFSKRVMSSMVLWQGEKDDYYNELLSQEVERIIRTSVSLAESGQPIGESSQRISASHEKIIQQANVDGLSSTVWDCIFSLVRSAASTHMDDGDIPELHAACSLSLPCLPRPILELILWMYPDQVLQHHRGNLPLHLAVQPSVCGQCRHCKDYDDKTNGNCLLRCRTEMHSDSSNADTAANMSEWKIWVQTLLKQAPVKSASATNAEGRLPLHLALLGDCGDTSVESTEARAEIVVKLVEAYPESVQIPDPVTGLFPFQQAAIVCPQMPLQVVYTLLRRSPVIALSSK